MFSKALILWFSMVALAIANGTFRVALLIPRFGETAGHIISTMMLSALIFLLTLLTIRWIAPQSPMEAVQIGLFWLLLTVAFEFGFGHFVARKPWSTLAADYNIAAGRIWILILITTFAAPYLTARLRNLF